MLGLSTARNIMHPIYNGTLIQYNECQGITKKEEELGACYL
jgi:hypothetical protein